MLAAISVGCCIMFTKNDKKYCPTPLHYTAGYIQISQACITYSKFLMFARCIFSLSKTSFKDSFVTCRFFTGSTNLFTHKYQSVFKKVCNSNFKIDNRHTERYLLDANKRGVKIKFYSNNETSFYAGLGQIEIYFVKKIVFMRMALNLRDLIKDIHHNSYAR